MHKISCYKLFTRKLPSGHTELLVGHLKAEWAFAQPHHRKHSTRSGCGGCRFIRQDPAQMGPISLHRQPLERQVLLSWGWCPPLPSLPPQIPRLCSTFRQPWAHLSGSLSCGPRAQREPSPDLAVSRDYSPLPSRTQGVQRADFRPPTAQSSRQKLP